MCFVEVCPCHLLTLVFHPVRGHTPCHQHALHELQYAEQPRKGGGTRLSYSNIQQQQQVLKDPSSVQNSAQYHLRHRLVYFVIGFFVWASSFASTSPVPIS